MQTNQRSTQTTLYDLPPLVRETVQGEVNPGETLVWAAQPVPRLFTGGTIGAVLFGIPWTAFAIFWSTLAFFGTRSVDNDSGAAAKSFSIFFPLFGVPFILVGLGMLSSPYWTRRRLKKTVYLLTDRRAVTIAPGWFGAQKVVTFEPGRLLMLERIERKDGSGDLIFDHVVNGSGSSTTTIRRGFLSVPNVREVEQLLRDTLLKDRVRDTRDDE